MKIFLNPVEREVRISLFAWNLGCWGMSSLNDLDYICLLQSMTISKFLMGARVAIFFVRRFKRQEDYKHGKANDTQVAFSSWDE